MRLVNTLRRWAGSLILALVLTVKYNREIVSSILLVVILGCAIKAYLLLDMIFDTTRQINKATSEIISVAKEQQKQVAILTKQSDDLVRIIDNTDISMRKVSQEIIPEVKGILKDVRASTLPQINKTLADTSTLILTCNDGAYKVSNEVIAEVLTLLRDPAIKETIDRIAKTSDKMSEVAKNAALTSAKVDASMKEITAWLPELIVSLRQIAANAVETTANVGTGTQYASDVLKRIAQPLSKKERFFQILLKIIAASGPSVVEVLRR